MTYLNRTLCDVLEEMRKCHETRNYSYLSGLIEEVQSMGNRMEAALSDGHDYERTLGRLKAAEKELKKTTKELEEKRELLQSGQ